MFPFLPALLLLLLQGPSNFERFLTNGLWWASTEAVVRSVEPESDEIRESVDLILPSVAPRAKPPVIRRVLFIGGPSIQLRDAVRRWEHARDGPAFKV
jgi:hypothetical protein